MNKIEPQYVTFEIAKLLKEKGFKIPVSQYYFEDGEFKQHSLKGTNGYYGEEYEFDLSEFNENWNDKWLTKKSGDRCFGCSIDKGYFETFSVPEIWQVVEWLRLKHNIWIECRHITTFNINRFHVIIWDYKDKSDYKTIHCNNGVGYKVWDTPKEAYLEVIEYTLNNLI